MSLDLHIYTSSIHCVLSLVQSCCQDMHTLFCYPKITGSEAVMEYKRTNCSLKWSWLLLWQLLSHITKPKFPVGHWKQKVNKCSPNTEVISFDAVRKKKSINMGIFKFLDSTKTGIRILCFSLKSERCFIPSPYGSKGDSGTLASGSTSIAEAVPAVGLWCLWALFRARAGVAIWSSSWKSYTK